MRPARACLLILLLVAGRVGAASGDEATPVTARALAAAAVAIEHSAPAEVEALARTRVVARLAADVDSLPVEIGDRVERGDTVARLDCTDYTTALERAEARLAELRARLRLANVRLERTRKLRERDAVSADRLDEADAERQALEASVRAQRARVDTARRDVERCTVAAPFDGLVVARPGEPGAFVQPGAPLVELVAGDRIELRARVTENDATTLAAAGRSWFRANGRQHALERIGIVEAADTRTRTRRARFRFMDGAPLPGTAGRVHWIAHPRAVPADLLVRRDGRLGVFVLRQGRARFRALPAAVEGRPVPTDLPADIRIVVDGRYGLTDGEPVRVIE